MASMPVATMPMVKSAKVQGPAMGRSASAAWPEVWMSVTPWALSVAAVARMMKSAIRLEKPMPTIVSRRIRASSPLAAFGATNSGLR